MYVCGLCLNIHIYIQLIIIRSSIPISDKLISHPLQFYIIENIYIIKPLISQKLDHRVRNFRFKFKLNSVSPGYSVTKYDLPILSFLEAWFEFEMISNVSTSMLKSIIKYVNHPVSSIHPPHARLQATRIPCILSYSLPPSLNIRSNLLSPLHLSIRSNLLSPPSLSIRSNLLSHLHLYIHYNIHLLVSVLSPLPRLHAPLPLW